MSTLISVKDVSRELLISEQHVRNLCRNGILQSEKIGQTWVVYESSLKQYKSKLIPLTVKDHEHTSNSVCFEKSKPIALSFFSGAMGLDLGIEKAGFDIRLACEIDKYCRQTISLNKPDIALLSDINDYSAMDIIKAAKISPDTDIDLVMGGPPCQAFSTAGKRKSFKDERGNVFLKYIDLVLELKPKYFIIENVRGILSAALNHRPLAERGDNFPVLENDEIKGGALNFILSKLKISGYAYSFNLYNAANFGTPQIRERVIIICSRNGKTPPYLTPTHSDDPYFELPHWNTLESSISDLKNHDHLNFPEKRLKYYRMLKPGQNWKNLPEYLQKEAMGKSFYSGGGKTGFLRRLAWDKPSPTLVTHPAMPATDLAHPEENRPLSIQEYKRIQEFPDNWKISGPLLQQYKQVGNAVPVSLGFAVGNTIINLLNGKEAEPGIPNFRYSRYKNTSDKEWEAEFFKIKKQ
ncbi:DNA cytosine methyltransferase [Musicola paradisiaca]|uniref:Cytosine-specific methyltransferase n=1 Tax=Musicola paradisiaca (strain Ech703) TaxID=579405 RepID=C6C5M8_MUSP7|nr:DNA cytosine methyltransferase [Musicola paradisiaca]ACS83841.1 DNA-cytosine methyltransferase [Musicola paradisiaca Ech703]